MRILCDPWEGGGWTEDGGGEVSRRIWHRRGAAGGKKAYTFLFSAIISISMWIYARTYTAPVRRGPRASRNLWRRPVQAGLLIRYACISILKHDEWTRHGDFERTSTGDGTEEILRSRGTSHLFCLSSLPSPSRSFFSLCPSLLYLRAAFCPFDIQSQSRPPLSLSLSLSWVSGDYYVVTGSSGRN